MVIKIKTDPQAFIRVAGFMACCDSMRICVCKLATGSRNVRGILAPQKVVAVNIMAAVVPAARDNPSSNPVIIPQKLWGIRTDRTNCHRENPRDKPVSRYFIGILSMACLILTTNIGRIIMAKIKAPVSQEIPQPKYTPKIMYPNSPNIIAGTPLKE